MNREPIRNPARSVANVEFHQTGDRVNETAHRIVAALGDRGIRAINPAMGFPMEMDRVGNADLQITADTRTWLGFLAKQRNLVWALLTRRIRLKGSPRLLLLFGRCFPS